MTVINPNSISGITSITLPAGADNVLTIHSNDGTERFRIDSSGNIKVGTAATISPDGDVFFTGVTTATTFTGAHSGSGANLTSLPAAQLSGTLPAISATNLTNIPAANITGTLPALTAANLTNIPAANIVGLATAGFERSGGFGKILKYTTFTHDGYVTGHYHGDPNSQSAGYQLIDSSYTPAAANSTIVLFTSSIVISEGVNHANNFWLSAWEGSNFISAVSGSGRYTSFDNYLNATTLSYIGTFTSGSTNARNIMFRTGCNDVSSNTSTIYINGNPNGSYSGNQNRFTVFLVELAP